jgi:hypothetical protein
MSLTQNFMPMEVKVLVTENCWEGLAGESDIFCIGMSCMYSMYVEYLDKWMEKYTTNKMNLIYTDIWMGI